VYLLTPEQYQADTFGTTLQSQLKMSVGKFELYTRLMGGEDKLPPKLPEPHLSETTNNSEQPAANASEDKIDPNKILDAFGNLQTYDDFVTAHPISAPHMTAHDSKKIAKAQQISAASRRRSSEADIEVDFTLDPRRGVPSELGMSFCPFLAITKFPYKYVDSAFRQPIATAFFDENKVYNRPWDL
jgi:hypothetical protein